MYKIFRYVKCMSAKSFKKSYNISIITFEYDHVLMSTYDYLQFILLR